MEANGLLLLSHVKVTVNGDSGSVNQQVAPEAWFQQLSSCLFTEMLMIKDVYSNHNETKVKGRVRSVDLRSALKLQFY